MTTTILCKSSAVQPAPGVSQTGPKGTNLPSGSQMADYSIGGALNPTTPPTNQTFHLIVTGTSGNVSATAQPIVSNDGINWTNYGTAITASSGASPNQQSTTGAAPWAFFSAYITPIASTVALAMLVMNA